MPRPSLYAQAGKLSLHEERGTRFRERLLMSLFLSSSVLPTHGVTRVTTLTPILLLLVTWPTHRDRVVRLGLVFSMRGRGADRSAGSLPLWLFRHV